MKAFRDEVELPPADRPRIIVRPDPFTIPREFYRGTAYNLATRGEAWWWVAARDIDDAPMSLINVPPHEVTVEENRDDLRYPIIEWRDRQMRNRDFRQLVYAREPGSLRGHGPLQMCGAAISVAVEAQEWAANLFAEQAACRRSSSSRRRELGDDPVTGRARGRHPARAVDGPGQQHPARHRPAASRTSPRWTRTARARRCSRRAAYQNVEVATMFNMDATILNAAIEGSSRHLPERRHRVRGPRCGSACGPTTSRSSSRRCRTCWRARSWPASTPTRWSWPTSGPATTRTRWASTRASSARKRRAASRAWRRVTSRTRRCRCRRRQAYPGVAAHPGAQLGARSAATAGACCAASCAPCNKLLAEQGAVRRALPALRQGARASLPDDRSGLGHRHRRPGAWWRPMLIGTIARELARGACDPGVRLPVIE